jgi:hypothetical protein
MAHKTIGACGFANQRFFIWKFLSSFDKVHPAKMRHVSKISSFRYYLLEN